MADDTGHRDYEHDVAFSLLDQDLDYAKQMEAKLRERFTTFLYSEQKKTLDWADGMDVLAGVYRTTSRAVVLLLRPDYGQTKWTRIELQAIKARFLEEGPDFLMVIAMEKVTPPRWLPPQYFFACEENWPLDDLVSHAAEKIKSLGGKIQKPSAVELARGKAIEREWKETHEMLVASQGATKLTTEHASLIAELTRQSDEMNPSLGNNQIQVRTSVNSSVVILKPCSAVLFTENVQEREIYPFYHQLCVNEFDGVFDEFGNRLTRQTGLWAESHFAVDVGQNKRWHWRNMRNAEVFTAEGLANHILTRLFKRATAIREGTAKPQWEIEQKRGARQSNWVNGWRNSL